MIVGLIVNPVAGMGGPAGLKGTDGADVLARARAAGSEPRSSERAARALAVWAQGARRDGVVPGAVSLLTGPGPLGEEAATAAGLAELGVEVRVLPHAPRGDAEDTRRLAEAMAAQGAALVLFAGGDGTARDVAAGLGRGVGDRDATTAPPVLGIPTGVKMYSGCFAVSPEAAGRVAAAIATGERMPTHEAEVLDVDEDQVRTGRVEPKLFALVDVPDDESRMQRRKVATVASERDAVEAVARGLAEQFASGVTYLVGPGGTTAAVLRHLGLSGTPLGVDVVRDGRLVALDVTGPEALQLIRDAPGPCRAVIGVIGGQGFVLGRGNQQLSAPVIRALRGSSPGGFPLLVGATQAKLLALGGRPLLVDTGDPETDRTLVGPLRVCTGPRTTAIYQLSAAEGS